MTFKEIIDITKDRINVLEEDVQIDNIIKKAVNYAYMAVASKVDKHTKEVELDVSSTLVLPSDFISLADISAGGYRLNKLDYEVQGDLLKLKATDLGSKVKINYVYYPPKLAADSDTPIIKEAYQLALPIYAHYAYMVYKKKNEVASMLFQEFNLLLNGKISKIEGENVES